MRHSPSRQHPEHVLRLATYNIHKGVRGVGPQRRLEIHNLGVAIEALDADLVFLQEVRNGNRAEARRFNRSSFGWPSEGQADFLAPEGYGVAYRTNAVTRDGEHGNALLSQGLTVHAVVVHFGLMHAGRVRQVQRLADFIQATVPRGELLLVAGDFNDWGEKLDGPIRDFGLSRAVPESRPSQRLCTFPSRIPIFTMDRIYTRGWRCLAATVPRGLSWARMSDHLPLLAELAPG